MERSEGQDECARSHLIGQIQIILTLDGCDNLPAVCFDQDIPRLLPLQPWSSDLSESDPGFEHMEMPAWI